MGSRIRPNNPFKPNPLFGSAQFRRWTRMRKYLVPAAGILCLGLSSWLVYLFFAGDSCSDAGGSFSSLAGQCLVAPGETYVPLYRQATWIFWVLYGALSLGLGLAFLGLLYGAAAGVRSLWGDVLHGAR